MNSQSAIDIQLASLIETSKILTGARRSLYGEPQPVWLKVANAVSYIDKQIAEFMGGAQ